MNQQNILEVKNLNMIYTTLEGNVNAVNDISFEIKKEVLLVLWGVGMR